MGIRLGQYLRPLLSSRIRSIPPAPLLTPRSINRPSTFVIAARMSTQLPKTMKAIREQAMLMPVKVHELGGPEVNVLDEVPVPTPGPGEALIKVEYSGVNFIDTYFRTGLYPKPLPYIIGQDAVGTIISLPDNYTPPKKSTFPPLEVGQRIVTSVGPSFAEYQTAPTTKIIPLPDFVKPEDGIALSTTALTAIALARESYAIKKGDWVLIRAAAGGTGGLLVQLAKYYGANIIGTVSSEEKAALARAHGVDHVLYSTSPSKENVEKILELTGGEGVQVVYDGVGKDTFEEDFEVVRRTGTIATFGNASGPPPAVSPLKLSPKALKLTRPQVGAMIHTEEELHYYFAEILEAVKAGALRVTNHKVYGFSREEVIQAQKDITSRSTTGKLVIKVA